MDDVADHYCNNRLHLRIRCFIRSSRSLDQAFSLLKINQLIKNIMLLSIYAPEY